MSERLKRGRKIQRPNPEGLIQNREAAGLPESAKKVSEEGGRQKRVSRSAMEGPDTSQ